MNARQSLLTIITALTVGFGAPAVHAAQPSDDLGLSPALVRFFACTGSCDDTRRAAAAACEAEVRAGGDATSTDLLGCLIEGINAEHDCLEAHRCLE
jgi:hypothetical protein